MKFVNWSFLDSAPGPNSLGFTDAHGVVTIVEPCGSSLSGVILFPEPVKCVEAHLRLAVPAQGATLVAYGSAALPLNPCNPALSFGPYLFGPYPGLSQPYIQPVTVTIEPPSWTLSAVAFATDTQVWGLDTLAFGR